MSKKELLLKIFLPFIIVLIGIVVTVAMVKLRSAPQRVTKTYSGPLVETLVIEMQDKQVIVPGTGTVQATQLADVTPQVSGKVKSISSRMVEGGFFNQGEVLFAIEPIDYELALERSRASLAQAELELSRNQSLAEIARLEWARLDQQAGRQANPLTLYEPQMKAAEAQVASARSAVRQAELDLSRTVVRAPFNCYVRDEQVDVGQYVRAGTRVATVAGTDAVEIVVPLQLEELAWLQVPRNGKPGKGSRATVRMQIGGNTHEWQGEVVRALGEVDPRTRMAKVVVAVNDPFGKQQQKDKLELSPGMFAEVMLRGAELPGVIILPRGAVRDHDTVWIVDENNKLQIRPIEIIRREQQDVLVAGGLKPGDRIVLTALAAAADGMLVRPQAREAVQ